MPRVSLGARRGSRRRGPGAHRRPRRLLRLGPIAVLSVLLAACAPTLPPGRAGSPPRAAFEFGRDTFAFPNLVRAENPARNAAFANYCIIMARSVSQFFRFARFDPSEPTTSGAEYTRLTRRVIGVSAWAPPVPDERRVVIPGYADLRAFSRAQAAAIKAAFGSNLLSMVHWRTWRVALALSPEHQRGVARELTEELDVGRPAPVMLTNFPDPDLLNHAVLIYDYRLRSGVVEFLAYDPNDPNAPLSVFFDLATRAFWVEPLPYSPPGRIRAFRLYASPLF